jgi:hypothetical protein
MKQGAEPVHGIEEVMKFALTDFRIGIKISAWDKLTNPSAARIAAQRWFWPSPRAAKGRARFNASNAIDPIR